MFQETIKIFKTVKKLVSCAVKDFQCEELSLGEIKKYLRSEEFETLAAQLIETAITKNPTLASPLASAALVLHVVGEILDRWRKDHEEKIAKIKSPEVVTA